MRYCYIACYPKTAKGRNGFGSRFIRRFTFSIYSHVSWVFDLGDHGLECEANGKLGVIKKRFDVDSGAILYPIALTEHQIEKAHELWMSIMGAKYDWSGIWGFVVRKKRECMDQWFCSEAVSWVAAKTGKPISRKRAFQHTPGDVGASFVLDGPVGVPSLWK